MRIFCRAAMVAAGIFLCTIASTSFAAPRTPTGKWIVDFANDECFLDREYGTAERPLFLAIRRFPMDDDLTIQIFTHDTGTSVLNGDAKVTFGAGESANTKFLSYRVAKTELRKWIIHVERGALLIGPALRSENISVRAGHDLDEDFAVPDLANALRLLDQCDLNLGKSWGISVEQQQRLKLPATSIRHDYLTSADYPEKELRTPASGRSQVRLTIDETGKPVDCVAMKSIDSPAFAATTCRILLERAAFHPAMDVGGKPMRSVVVYTVDWLVAS